MRFSVATDLNRLVQLFKLLAHSLFGKGHGFNFADRYNFLQKFILAEKF